MVSPEFRATVSEGNLLRTRIMLKDSFVLDPTFAQFEEMLDYAKPYFPDLFDPFDGEILEDDSSKWDEALMNKELVQLISNFSKERVDHLKMVVAKVLEAEAAQARFRSSEQYSQQYNSARPTQNSGYRQSARATYQPPYGNTHQSTYGSTCQPSYGDTYRSPHRSTYRPSRADTSPSKRDNSIVSELGTIRSAAENIQENIYTIMTEVINSGRWKASSIDEIESATNSIDEIESAATSILNSSLKILKQLNQ